MDDPTAADSAAAFADPAIGRAYAYLRRHTNADIRFDEHHRPIHYVMDSEGHLVAPVMVAMLQTMDTVLYIPESTDDAMAVLVTLAPFDEDGMNGHLADRWRIHHGDPPDVRWARMSIDMVRYREMVIDGDVMMRPNPWAEIEPVLCRELNEGDLDLVRAAAFRVGNVNVPEPRVVSVDPSGVDIRARFGVLHLPFDARAADDADPRAEIAAMLAAAGDGADA